MKIHHAVAKKAAKHQITIEASKDAETGDFSYTASHADLPKPAMANDAKTVLNAALKALGYKPSKPKVAANKNKKSGGKKAKAKKAAIVANKSIVRQPYKDAYKTKGSGQGCGDRLDVAMRDALEGDSAALTKVAKSNNVPFVWAGLNPGLQRMNLTNVLRARVKRGEKIDVMGKTIASL